MSKLEQEYKNRFKDLGSLQGIDPDLLWEGITDNLDSSEKMAPAETTKNQTLRWIVLIAFLLIMGGLFCFDFNKSNSVSPDKVALPIQKSTNDPLPSNNQNIEINNVTSQVTELKNNETQNLNAISKQNTSSNKANIVKPKTTISNSKTLSKKAEQQGSNNKPNKSKNKNLIVDSKKSSNTKLSKKDQPSLIDLNNTSKSKTNNSIKSTKQLLNKNNLDQANFQKPTAALTPLELLPIIDFFVRGQYPKTIDNKLPETKKFVKPKKRDFFEVAASTGVNTMFLNYKKGISDGSLINELKESISAQPGWSTSLRFSWVSGQKFSISSGIDHDLIRLKFSTTKNTNTTFTDDNYLFRFDIDPVTRDTINRETGSKDLNAQLTRNVRHYNNFRLLSIPLEFGFQNQKGKLGYGISLGVSANFFISQKGKTLNANQEIYVIDDKLEDLIPFKKFFIAYQLTPFVDYEIAKNTKLRFNPIVKYQSLGKSSLYGIDQTSIFVGLNAGVVWRIGESK